MIHDSRLLFSAFGLRSFFLTVDISQVLQNLRIFSGECKVALSLCAALPITASTFTLPCRIIDLPAPPQILTAAKHRTTRFAISLRITKAQLDLLSVAYVMPRIPTAKLASKAGASQRHNPLPQQLQQDQLTSKFGLVSAPGRRSKKSAKPQSASDDEQDQKQYAAPAGMVTGGKSGGANTSKKYIDPKLSRNILRNLKLKASQISDLIEILTMLLLRLFGAATLFLT